MASLRTYHADGGGSGLLPPPPALSRLGGGVPLHRPDPAAQGPRPWGEGGRRARDGTYGGQPRAPAVLHRAFGKRSGSGDGGGSHLQHGIAGGGDLDGFGDSGRTGAHLPLPALPDRDLREM